MSIDERFSFMAFLNMVNLYKIFGFDLCRDKVINYCKNNILEIENEKVKDKRIRGCDLFYLTKHIKFDNFKETDFERISFEVVSINK